jgi:hypothetical protein
MVKDVEFNNGFVTALALFYGHYWQGAYGESEHGVRIYPAIVLERRFPSSITNKNRRLV